VVSQTTENLVWCLVNLTIWLSLVEIVYYKEGK